MSSGCCIVLGVATIAILLIGYLNHFPRPRREPRGFPVIPKPDKTEDIKDGH